MRFRIILRHSVLIALVLSVAPQAGRGEGGSGTGFLDKVQVHGFASQALVYTDENRWMGDSPNGSLDFTEIGVNASIRFTPGVLLSGQVLVRRAGDMYDGSPVLDYGLLDVALLSSAQHRVGVRIGRIKNPLGLYNETRDVPFTRPGIFLPQVVYFDRVRNLVLSSDGAMFYAETYQDFGNLSLLIGNGRGIIDENVEWAYLNADFPGDMKPDSNTWLGRLWYTTPDERIKLGLSGAALSTRFDPHETLVPTLQAGSTDLQYGIASFQYDAEKWTLSAEYAIEPLKWRDYGPLRPDRDVTSEGWYVQGTYRIRPELDLMLRWEQGVADTADRNGTRLEARTGGLLPAHVGYSKALTTGLRWDISRHWMLRAEYSYHEGTFTLSARENPIFSEHRKYWHLFAVQASFRF
jgi:hypothetical protein